jgi:diguanylate cyclase (GGDEF)-like protein
MGLATTALTPHRLTAVAWTAVAVGAVVAGLHLAGVAGGVAVLVVVVAVVSLAALPVAIRHRDGAAWPCTVLVVAGFAGAIGLVEGPIVDAGGDPDVTRHLSGPASLIAYVLVLAGLVGLLRRHTSLVPTGVVLTEAAIAGLATVLVLWALLVDPVVIGEGERTSSELLLMVFPSLAMMLLVIAIRLTLIQPRVTASHVLLVTAAGLLAVGEVLLLAVGADDGSPGGRALEIPGAVGFILLGAAVLHPAMPTLADPAAERHRLHRAQLVLVVIALLVTIGVLGLWQPASRVEQLVGIVLGSALAVLAAGWLVAAGKEHAHGVSHSGDSATRDPVSGLPNRDEVHRLLTRMLATMGRAGKPVAVLSLDVDQLALVNDTYGHNVGDQVLAGCGASLRAAAGPEGQVGRASGDEFVILAPGRGVAEAWALASTLRQGFWVPAGGVDHFITLSIGIAVSERTHHQDAATLLHDAEAAAYHAKVPGHNGVALFHPAMLIDARRRSALQHGLRSAIQNAELAVHYQPIVSMNGGRIERLEALLRWSGPSGSVSPDDFIPVAEDTGLITTIGAWALTEACRQVAEWRTLEGCEDLAVAVNVSARQVSSTDLVATVSNALRVSGLPGDALWLEITEGAMLEDSSHTMSVLLALRGLGVQLSVDDFGTGFSSLAYLDRFPVQQVKVDRTFVQALGPRGQAPVVSAIFGMADALGLEVVAEGVEKDHQLDRLERLGCRLAQGYLFAPPLAADVLTDILAERRLSPGGVHAHVADRDELAG